MVNNKRVKIGFVLHSLGNGGAERVVAALANQMILQHDVAIIMLTNTVPFYTITPAVQIIALNENPHSTNVFKAVGNNLKTINRLKKTIKQNAIDILIGFTTNANVLALLAAKKAQIPCIISERNNAQIAPPNRFWQFLRNKTYNSANFLVVQTEGNRKFYTSLMDAAKIKIIQNPVATEIANVKRNEEQNREPLLLLTVGRLNVNKAHEVILKALQPLRHYNWVLHIVGGGPVEGKLKQSCLDLGLADRVVFTGSIQDVGSYYQQADIFLFTSRSEGFPNALMEANFLGIPCVATDCDFGPSDILTDGHDGFLVPVDDVTAMTCKIKVLLEDSSLREQFGAYARTRADRFAMEKVADQWMALIIETLDC